MIKQKVAKSEHWVIGLQWVKAVVASFVLFIFDSSGWRVCQPLSEGNIVEGFISNKLFGLISVYSLRLFLSWIFCPHIF